MNGALNTPDVEQFRAFKAGNEDALASIYRSEYDALVQLAGQKLGEEVAHASPRIAQQAMLDAWQARDRFDNPVGLVAYLEEAVAELANVQRRKHLALSRRSGGAAPRKAGSPPTAEQAAEQLLATLHAPAQTHDELLQEAKAAKKAHAAEHVQKVGKAKSWKGPAIFVGVLILIAAAGLWYVDSRGEDIAMDSALKSEDARRQNSGNGQRGTVKLSDGTNARMGADTHLRMPKDFSDKKMRTVELTGVAQFEVAPGKEAPFKVRAGKTIITATGTTFAVRAYEGDSVVLVSVTEGSVNVAVRDENTSQAVAAGSSVRVANGVISPLDAADRDRAMAWMNDSLIFVDTPVKDVLPELGRWYDSHPTLEDPSLGERKVTLRLPLKSSGEALKSMADSAHLLIDFDKDKHVVLKDAPVAPSSKPAAKKRK